MGKLCITDFFISVPRVGKLIDCLLSGHIKPLPQSNVRYAGGTGTAVQGQPTLEERVRCSA